jgi:transcription elongation factor GreA
MNNTYKITASKKTELEDELETLRTKGRKSISDKLSYLRELPNSQNDEDFSVILDDKRYLEKRINEIKEVLSNCEVIEENGGNGRSEVDIGSKVKVGLEGFEETYMIVSAIEADPLEKKISDESPVGRALLGSKIGDNVTVELGNVRKKLRVLDIE